MSLLKQTINHIGHSNPEFWEKAAKRQQELLKPPGSLGDLEILSIRLAGIYEKERYEIKPKSILAFAGDHGVHDEGISTQPQEVTAWQFPNYVNGMSSMAHLAQFYGAHVKAVDVGINCDAVLKGIVNRKIRKGTKNMAKGPAMTREEAVLSLEIGIEEATDLIEKGYKVIGLGEMGICNTTPSSAMIAVFLQKDPCAVTGLGAGTLPEGIAHKIQTIEKAIALNNPDPADPIDVLAKVGGFEIGAMAGAILTCASRRIPVVLDGFISYAAAILAKRLCPSSVEFMFASHVSSEPASIMALHDLDLNAPLHMNMRLGEGSGAALFFTVMDAAVMIYETMPTFSDSAIPPLKTKA